MNPKLVLEEGRYYHVYNRGNNRCKLFYEDRNYDYFLRLYEKYISLIAETYAWVLMGNHFHFLIKVKNDLNSNGKKLDPSRQFAHLFNAYAQAINKSIGRTGTLFEHTFERKEVTSDEYLRELIVYIHRNPQKHRFAGYFKDYPWSSFNSIVSVKSGILQYEEVIRLYGGVDNFIKAHEEKGERNDGSWLIE
jgi:REP element-mobilizing transposase RayT